MLRFIEQAQGLGFTLREIADVEIGAGEDIASCSDALILLARKHDTFTALIADARDRRHRIEALMAEVGGKPGQGANDRGASYRSGNCYLSDAQHQIAQDSVADVEATGVWPGRAVTEVKPAGDYW